MGSEILSFCITVLWVWAFLAFRRREITRQATRAIRAIAAAATPTPTPILLSIDMPSEAAGTAVGDGDAVVVGAIVDDAALVLEALCVRSGAEETAEEETGAEVEAEAEDEDAELCTVLEDCAEEVVVSELTIAGVVVGAGSVVVGVGVGKVMGVVVVASAALSTAGTGIPTQNLLLTYSVTRPWISGAHVLLLQSRTPL